jgi:hypothetical protein
MENQSELTALVEKVDVGQIESPTLKKLVKMAKNKSSDEFKNWTDTNWKQWRDYKDGSIW